MCYPHLFETTMLGYNQRTYTMSIGVTEEDLTDEERRVLEDSKEYVKEYEVEYDRKILKAARKDFERLRDIEGLPDEAVAILKEWTHRAGDDDEDDE